MNELQTINAKFPTELTDIELDSELDELNKGLEEAENRLKPYYIRYGELLNEKKKRTPHGHWMQWIDENCSFGRSTAQRYMSLASNYPRVGNLDQTSAHISQRQALEIIREPRQEILPPEPSINEIDQRYQEDITQLIHRLMTKALEYNAFVAKNPKAKSAITQDFLNAIERAKKAIDALNERVYFNE